MTRSVPAAFGLCVLGLLGLIGGCSDDLPPGPQIEELSADAVSDPAPIVSAELHARPSGLATLSASVQVAGETEVAYVSLPPGRYPGGVTAVIRNVNRAGTVTAPVIDGGLDPVPVAAATGDSVEVEILAADGASVARVTYLVPGKRRPKVVRTVPPRGKTDVPVNQSVVIVFSEPVAEGTLSSAVQLFQGGSEVPGAVRLLQGTTTQAVFEPAATLLANTRYRLVVTEAVRDLQGDALEPFPVAEFTTGTTTVGPAKMMTVFPDTAALAIGSQVQLVATAHDTNFTAIVGRPITWTTDNPAVATVSATGLVTAHAEGAARIRAEMDGRSAGAIILVSLSHEPVASVEVRPESDIVLVGGVVQLEAVLKDARGNIVRHRRVEWESSSPTLARVTPGPGGTAAVTRLAPGAVSITATSEGKRGTATITSGTVGPYAQIAADGSTCAITTGSRAWCWGGSVGALGVPTAVPSAVAGGLSFSLVAVGLAHTCALTTDGAAYCWGENYLGQLGIGTMSENVYTPTAVAGGLTFTALSAGRAGSAHTCGLTPNGVAYCWGSNQNGWLGNGTTVNSPVPVRVTGGLAFTALSAGSGHTCGLTLTGAAYCWGRNHSGALGDGSPQMLDRVAPVPVAGGLSFVAITAGLLHNCGLTADGSAYCWGLNDEGQLGVGTTGPQVCTPHSWNCSRTPVRVAGNQRWETISAGSYYTCALTTDGAAYCWGRNYQGQLGIDTMSGIVYTPTAVAGGLTFTALSAGSAHTCGLTPTGVAYCWGDNQGGQLGNGTTVNSPVPVRVAGQP